ncbi:MAG: adenine deaminase [Acholeplasmatales bacterium]|nr:MAG: adenine deaminase [Acholeplasmatales bacterium]
MDPKHAMNIARGLKNASRVLKNAKIVNVYTGEIEKGDIAMEDGVIVGVGAYKGVEEIDVNGRYVAPGFIDGHVHIESSMLTPPAFASLVVPKGTTTIIADPHEIANISGIDGIRFMVESSRGLPLEVHVMIPSCVPATAHENNGATIDVSDIEALKHTEGILGLGEVMDYPAVLEGQKSVHQKIAAMRGCIIDGHAPDIVGKDLNAYVLAGVMTDHECTVIDAMLDRIRRGMYVHLREGSATRNVATLIQGVTKDNLHRTLFCTDDKHPEDILKEGHINYNINLAIKHGLAPVDAIRMATLHAAQCYRLDHLGAIAPGKQADLVVFDDLYNIQPIDVYKRGVLVASQGKALFKADTVKHTAVTQTVNIKKDTVNFALKLQSEQVHVIGLIPQNITTEKHVRTVKVESGAFSYDPDRDIMKLAVIERHRATGNMALGLVEGFGFKGGALAMTIAHDSHNIIVVGSDDASMHAAVERIVEIQGGIVLVENGLVIDQLQLEIGGIMTNQAVETVQGALKRMHNTLMRMGLAKSVDDPFISLSFLALPVIPKLKLTDIGLFDVEQFAHVSIEVASNNGD